MCGLEFGLTCAGEPLELRVPCEYTRVAAELLERLAAAPWPKLDTLRLELWPHEPPYLLRAEFVYSATVHHCKDYAAYLKAQREVEDAGVDPGHVDEPEPKAAPPTTKRSRS